MPAKIVAKTISFATSGDDQNRGEKGHIRVTPITGVLTKIGSPALTTKNNWAIIEIVQEAFVMA